MKGKKLFALLTALFLLFNLLTASVWALTPKLESDISDDSVAISGTLDLNRFGTNILLVMKDSSGNEILADSVETFIKSGEIVYQFPKILLPSNLKSGKYIFEISGEDIPEPIQITYDFVGADLLLGILESVRDSENVAETLKNNHKALGLDTTVLDDFQTEGLTIFEKVMNEVSYDLPDGYDSEEDKAKIKLETKKLISAYNDAVCFASFESIDDSGKAKSWLDTYYAALEFNVDDSETSYSEKLITDYLNTVKNGSFFVNRLKTATELDSKEKIQAYIYETALLAVVAEKRGSVVKEMILALPEFFEIDTENLNKLSSVKQANCFSAVAGNDYESCELAADALNAEIGNYTKTSSKDSGGGGGSGSGSRKDNTITVVTPPSPDADDTNRDSANKTVFDDMDNAKWAMDAVNELNRRNIINGKGNGKFEPSEYVTRAEFIKIIASAMALKTDERNTPFPDVPKDAWFAPFVAAACREGITTGDDFGMFNPYAKITREDMVTMLYRVLKADVTVATLSFADADEVSVYAKDAVSYFSKKGIVNGMGDGTFAPKANATRAQAAVIVYNIIMAK